MHGKTIGCIRKYIDVNVFYHVSHETIAKTLWKTLESL